jgi:hypothetical protein
VWPIGIIGTWRVGGRCGRAWLTSRRRGRRRRRRSHRRYRIVGTFNYDQNRRTDVSI